nr:MAG TPA: hypothetical protein [Caudoviricetes sp.]
MADTTHHRAPPFNHLRRTEAPPPRRRWGLVVLRPVESVGPGEAVQQSARAGGRPLIVGGDEGDLEDGAGKVGVHGEAGEARPNGFVGHRVLVGVVPSVGDVQRLNGVDAAVVTRLVEGPGLAGAGGVNPVDDFEFDGLEGWAFSAVDGGVHFSFPPWSVELFRWYKNAPGSWLAQGPEGMFSVIL